MSYEIKVGRKLFLMQSAIKHVIISDMGGVSYGKS